MTVPPEFKTPHINLKSVRDDSPKETTRDYRWAVASAIVVIILLTLWAWFNIIDAFGW